MKNIQKRSASFTAENFHATTVTYLIDTSGGNVTVTLEDANDQIGQEYIIYHNVSGNTLTVVGSNAQLIAGSSTYTSTTADEFLHVLSTGTEWISVSGGGSAADNLGDHTATQALNMDGNDITSAGDIDGATLALTGALTASTVTASNSVTTVDLTATGNLTAASATVTTTMSVGTVDVASSVQAGLITADTDDGIEVQASISPLNEPAFYLKIIDENGQGSTGKCLVLENTSGGTIFEIQVDGDIIHQDGASFRNETGDARIQINTNSLDLYGQTVLVESSGGSSVLEIHREIKNSATTFFSGSLAFSDPIRGLRGSEGEDGDLLEGTSTNVYQRGGWIFNNINSLTTGGTYLMRAQNAGTTKWSVRNNGGLSMGYASANSSYTSVGEGVIGVNSTSAPVTITLAATDVLEAGRYITVMDFASAAASNDIYIALESGTLDGSSAVKTITTDGGSRGMISNGTGWRTVYGK